MDKICVFSAVDRRRVGIVRIAERTFIESFQILGIKAIGFAFQICHNSACGGHIETHRIYKIIVYCGFIIRICDR